jgi:hypothetical protein
MVLLRVGLGVPQAFLVAEIAAVLGLCRDTVYRRLTHTLAQLRRLTEAAQNR